MNFFLNKISLLFFSFIFLNLSIYFSMLELNLYNKLLTFLYFFSVCFLIIVNKFKLKIPLRFLFFYFLFFIANSIWISFSDNIYISDFFYKNIFYFLFFISTYFLFLKTLENNFKIDVLFKFLLLLCVFFNFIDFFDNGIIFAQFSGFENRSAGFFINANNSAYAILTCLSVIICFSDRKISWHYFIISLLGVLLTLSRGGIMVWVFILFLSSFLGKITMKDMIISFMVPLVFLFNFFIIDNLFFSYSQDYGLLTNRLGIFSGQSDVRDVYDDSRYELVNLSLKVFLENPLWGNGFFSLLKHGSDQLNHNQYLLILTDYGLIGFLVFIVMLCLVYSKKNIILFYFLLISGFFTHEFFYSYTFLTIFALLLSSKFQEKY